jgi:hypothetical protein
VLVVIPVLGRPQNAATVIESLRQSDPDGVCEPVFVCSPGDNEQHEAAVRTGAFVLTVPWQRQPGDFARKTNHAAALPGDTDWVFAGADDLRFHYRWAEEAITVGEHAGAGMVGTDDLGNRQVRQGRHSTHSLFHRGYVEHCGTVDEPGKIYHEGYDHQHVDVEAYETAVARGCFVFAARSRVEHLHPFWHKAELDETYRTALRGASADRLLFERRRHLWQRAAA